MSYCVIVLMLFKFIFYDFIITFYWIYMFICALKIITNGFIFDSKFL